MLLLSGCATRPPTSFSHVQEAEWNIIETDDSLDYPEAWEQVFMYLSKEFDIDKALRNEGYLRTGWLYTWSEDISVRYRVRVSVQFLPERDHFRFRSEAHYFNGTTWVPGTDMRLVSTLRTDLMGLVGRQTR